MSAIADRFRRLSDAFADRIASVPADRWESPSPCEGWTARDVVAHLVDLQRRFLGLVGRDVGTVPDVASDPAGAWDAARRVVLADLEDPERASAEYEGQFGRNTFEQAIERFVCVDLVVHSWDLARATGQDERLDPDDVRWVLAFAERLPDAVRGPQTFGPAVEVPPDADDQARMLALLGRRP